MHDEGDELSLEKRLAHQQQETASDIAKQVVLLPLEASYPLLEGRLTQQNNLFWSVTASDTFSITVTLVNAQVLRELCGKVTLLTKTIKKL